jgi:outer membrane protein insertion porin family
MVSGVRLFHRFGVIGLVFAQMFVASVVVTGTGASTAYAQSASLIIVQGNRRVDADTIRSYFRLSPGERLDAQKIDAALKALYATDLFQDVRITSAGGGRIVVTVVENAVINRVAFEGNRRVKDEQLRAEIQSQPRGALSRPLIQADVQRIIEIYQHVGRYNVRVEPKIIELPSGRVDLVFEITEGRKTGVAAIHFVGNRAYSDYRLRDVIKTSVSSLLSFLKPNDIFDPDRIEADRELLRRFYLRNGFADVRIVSAVAEFDQARNGFVVTFTIDEGDRYTFGSVNVLSTVPGLDPELVRARLRTQPGAIYNADAVEQSVEDLTVTLAKIGYPFASIRPRGDRNFEARRINLVYTVEQGQRAYIERINIRGNTRTRDYVIRREFDIVEGDAYNRALIDRAERRIKNLNYFKVVRITTEPGSAPDRVIVNVDVEEQSTGEFSVSGGYSTHDGFLGEVSVGERNLLGQGHVARASIQYGQYARGFTLSFVEPYLLGQRLALGLDIFAKETTSAQYTSYTSSTIGGSIKLGIPVNENVALQTRYSAYQQEIQLPFAWENCTNIGPNSANGTYPTSIDPPVIDPATGEPFTRNCYADGEASLAVKRELAQGPVLVSLVGYTVSYNTLNSNRSPTSGLLVSLNQDLAGVGGDVNFLKTTVDSRLYNEVVPDVVSMLRIQGGYVTDWGGKELRTTDEFQGGPNIVRGFQPGGFGPRDLTPGSNQDALGGSVFWGASLEVQTPLFFAPKDFGMRLAAFADAGQVLDYQGPLTWPEKGIVMSCPNQSPLVPCIGEDDVVRSAVGVGLIWDSPFGPLRFDLAYALSKADYDRTQVFRFSGGSKF